MSRTGWKWYRVSSAEVEKSRRTLQAEEFFTPRELQQYQSMISEGRKRDFYAGRLAAKNLLRQWIQQKGTPPPPWSLIGIYNSPQGIPKIKWENSPRETISHPTYSLLASISSISIAHCEGNAVAALSPTLSVGVDIQRTRPIPARTIHRFLTPRELAHLQQLNPYEEWEAFHDFWVLKEAIAKALHIPLYPHLHDIEVFPHPSAFTAGLRLASHFPSIKNCQLILRPWKEYKIALCAVKL